MDAKFKPKNFIEDLKGLSLEILLIFSANISQVTTHGTIGTQPENKKLSSE